MAKFQLTISSEYVKDWALWEGVREVLQNAIDGATDGYNMSVDHDATCDTLTVTSQGARLDRSVWLMGMSSKAGSDRHIGHFGEGLKLGVLALVRAGHGVVIRNDDETWTPGLEGSDAFPGQRVLTIRTRAVAPCGRFTISIGGVTAEQWSRFRRRFLVLNAEFDNNRADTTANVMRLHDPVFKGQLFVKGIYVADCDNLAYGYNFVFGVETDRDRKMVSPCQADFALASYWTGQAGTSNQDTLMELLETAAEDVKEVPSWASSGARECLHLAFLEKHGEKAYPCRDLLEAQKLEHYGHTPVVVSAPYLTLFHRHGLTMEAANKAHANDVKEVYPLDALTRIELAVYAQAIELVSAACQAEGLPDPRNITQVGRFGDPLTQGMFHRKDGKSTITIARSVLTSLPKTLQVLVHEVAHHVGNDGDVAHERCEGRIFSAMVCSALAVAA